MVLKLGSQGKEVKELQKLLNNVMKAKLTVDGDFGRATRVAVIKFQELHQNLSVDGIAGEKTIYQLTAEAIHSSVKIPPKDKETTPWISKAVQEIGVNEIDNEDAVHQYWRDCKLSGLSKFSATQVPWCSGFTCAMLERAGIKSRRTDGAKNHLQWGKELDKPAFGCIVVFKRGSNSGHVGFVVGVDDLGHLMVLGGNQGNSVKISAFRTDRVIGYRYPEEFEPNYHLPEMKTTEISKNEE